VRTLILIVLSWFFPVFKVSSQKDRKVFSRIWLKIWKEEGYYRDPNQDLIGEFSKYDRYSVDFLVKFLGLFPCGTARMIFYAKEIQLPVIKDFTVRRVWNSNQVAEITLLAVPRNYRRFLHLPMLVMLREMTRHSRKVGLEGVLMMVDKRFFFAMKDTLGFPIQQIGEERFYEGSITYPAYIEIEEFCVKMAKVNRFFLS